MDLDISSAKEQARQLAHAARERGETADEFVAISQVGTSKIYIAASDDSAIGMPAVPSHANPRDCYLFIFEGHLELSLTATGQTLKFQAGQGVLIPAGLEHTAYFPEMTLYFAVVDEEEI